jgi:histidyl-tRNA synthetase
MTSIEAPKGTSDILPEVVGYWQLIEQAARDIFGRAAYAEIRTPMFERTELFARGIGEATDVVGKEMYTFVDKGERSMTLRPEGTAGVVRAYIENGLHVKGSLQRLWYIGPMFRYENVQAGRQRQFHQLGLEVLGSADVRADVEVIALAVDFLKAIGIPDLRLDLNSVGTSADRQRYRQALVEYLTPYKDGWAATQCGFWIAKILPPKKLFKLPPKFGSILLQSHSSGLSASSSSSQI